MLKSCFLSQESGAETSPPPAPNVAVPDAVEQEPRRRGALHTGKSTLNKLWRHLLSNSGYSPPPAGARAAAASNSRPQPAAPRAAALAATTPEPLTPPQVSRRLPSWPPHERLADLSQAERYLQHIEQPGAWLGQPALQALADHLACDLQIWRQDNEQTAVLDLTYPEPGVATAPSAPSRHRTARLLFHSGHYTVVRAPVTPQAKPVDLQQLRTLDVGGEGDCALLGFAYALNIAGFASQHDFKQRQDVAATAANDDGGTAYDEDYRAARETVVTRLRLGLSDWLGGRLQEYGEPLTLGAISDANDIMEMVAAALEQAQYLVAQNQPRSATDALDLADDQLLDVERLQGSETDARLGHLKEKALRLRTQLELSPRQIRRDPPQ